ncbi:MAG: small multi-drug export protein [Oscillospiraceae bacterium]|nr:small multi-drug export protein [Oscillospiraceae bacterium]
MNLWNSLLGKLVMTLLIAMAPVVELRGAIPIATAHGLPLGTAIAVAIVGNLIPVPFIIIFIRKILAWMRRRIPRIGGLVAKLEARAAKKSDVVLQYAFWGLFVLVAIPLPGTGAWTGALVAAMLDMRLKKAFPAIALGVVAAGIIVALLTYSAGTILF